MQAPHAGASAWARDSRGLFARAALRARLVVALAITVVAPLAASAGTFEILNREFTRDTGQPQTVTLTVRAPSASYVLLIETDRVASAVVTLNGRVVVGPSRFNNNVSVVEQPVVLSSTNTISVEVRGKPGGRLRLRIVGTDNELPTIRATASPAANAAGWNNSNVTVSFACDDSVSGIASCPAPVVVSREGAGQVVSGEAVDVAGNRATATLTLNIDKTAPSIAAIVDPSPNAYGWVNTNASVHFTCADALSGVAACTPDQLLSQNGANQVVDGTAVDRAGNVASASTSVSIDKAPPSIVASLSTPPNAQGWHNAPVTVSFTCTDDGAGIDTCPPRVVVNGEGAGQVISGSARDRAGNTAEARVTVNLDLTAPTVVAHLSEPPNAAGWHHRDVTITYTCEDARSAISQCPSPRLVSGEGADQQFTASAIDAAGNTATSTSTISLDKTPPAITPAISPAPNAAGWNSTPATVSFACSDALSGIAGCTAPVLVAEDTAGASVPGTATDLAGNTAVTGQTVKVDLTPPTIRAIPSAEGPVNTNVLVRFECEDALSGIASCPDQIEVTTEGLNQAVEGIAIDRAGHEARGHAVVSVDRTAPLIIAVPLPAANADGWNNTPVTVHFQCEDTGVGVASCPGDATVDTEGATQQVTGTATDTAGNRASAIASLNIDRTPPSIAATASTPAWTNADVVIAFECADALSGVKFCPSPATVTAEGTHEIRGTAVDRADNTALAAATALIDRTPPAIQAQLSEPPNGNGWHKAAVTVSFACADEGSGIASCPSPVTVSTEGAGQVVSGEATDRAGNTATTQVTVNLDTSAPSISVASTTQWSATDVIVTFECSDAVSGIATCPPQQTFTTEGSFDIEGIAVDRAGNTAVTRASVQVDKTPPEITATLAPLPNAAGWLNTEATVSFTCADAMSGIDSCPPPIAVGSEGAAQVVSGVARDRAGNTASASVTLNIDRTAPVLGITALPPANANGWNNTVVTVSFACADAVSGVPSCPDPVVVSAEGHGAPTTWTLSDQAGNIATASVAVNIDRTPPSLAFGTPLPAPNGAGWHDRDVTIPFSATDALSGIDTTDPSGGVLILTGEGSAITGTVTVIDRAGNQALFTSEPVNIDRTAPSITAAQTPQPNANGWNTSDVTVTFTCNDAISTLACPDPVTVSSEGASQVVTRSVSDAAGHSASATARLNIDKTPPSIVVSAPAQGTTVATSPVNVTGTVADDISGMASVTCNGLPGAVSAGTFACELPLIDGANTITIVAIDAAGLARPAALNVTFNPNRPPVARVGGPYTGDLGTAITMDGSASTDPDDDHLSFLWNFGDGGAGSGNIVRHTYATTGTFTVTVTVSDGRGGTHSASTQATIRPANVQPTASAGGPYSGESGAAVTFDGSASHDPDNDPLEFSWSFGDGTTGAGANATHAYASPGTYTVSLTVNDGRGGTSSASTQAVISAPNQRPTSLAGGPYSGEAGLALQFNGSASSDPDQDALTFAWAFGDGGVSTGATPTHAYSTPGRFTVTLTVSDGRGGTDAQTTTADIAAHTNHAPVANAGGPYHGEVNIPVTFNGAASTDPDKDPLTITWNFGDGTAPGSGATPVHVYASAGTFAVTATVRDAAGLTSTATTTAVIAPAIDTAPPAVDLTGPTEVLPGTDVTITARPADSSRVRSASFQVGGGPAVPVSGGATYQHVIRVPDVAAPGTPVVVRVNIVDENGRVGTAELTLRVGSAPDAEPPHVNLQCPPSASPGAVVRISATASDNVGVSAVRFSSGGTLDATVVAPPYEAAYAVPTDAVAGSSSVLSSEAVDFSGNRATTSCSVAIAADALDDTAPTIALTVPAEARPGQSITVTATASDNVGVVSVAFEANGSRIATRVTPPFAAEFVVPATLPPGAWVPIVARATDFAGNEASDSGRIVVAGAPGVGDALISGEVYDDTTGLPLAGAAIDLTGHDTSGAAFTQSVATDERGRYVLRAPQGDATLRVSFPGWTMVDRAISTQSGMAVEPIDARLTPLTGGQDVSPMLGAQAGANGAQLEIPPGAISAPTRLFATRLGQQGLQGILPAGWSPLAVADVTPHGVAFDMPAVLRLSVNAPHAVGRSILLARWDEQMGAWRAVATSTLSPAAAIDASIESAGQFAWLLADTAPQAPAMPPAGELVPGVTRATVPADATTIVEPQPKFIFYQPGVRAEVHGTVTSPAPLASGTPIQTKIIESYAFLSGEHRYPEPFVQDLFLYQAGGEGVPTRATYPVTPSLTFPALSLERGVIGVELHAPAANADPAAVIGPAGGSVESSSGARAEFAAGAVDAAIPVRLTSINELQLGPALPSDLAFVGAVSIALAGRTLSVPVTLSIPLPAGLDPSSQLLLAKVTDLAGGTRLVLVGLGTVSGDRITSSFVLPRNLTVLPGVTSEGRYVFLRALKPIGFVAGHVVGAAGGFSGALVTSTGLDLASLSTTGGAFVSAAAIGAVTLTARDLVRNDSGSGTGALAAARDEIAFDLRLVAQRPAVIAITPAEGETRVPLATPVIIRFSEPIDAASVTGANLGNIRLLAPDQSVVVGAISVSADGTTVTFRPAEPLASNTGYALTVTLGVKDRTGDSLASALTVHFTTLDTSAPAPPPAASITASIPTDGETTIVATQGTAGVHDAVSITNLTTGFTVPALVDPNGGFTVVMPASVGDKLQLRIVDRNGRESVSLLGRFQNPDGSVVIGPEGGQVTAANGVIVDVPTGAFPEGAIVKLTALAAADVAAAMSNQYSFVSAFELSTSVEPNEYLKASVPIAPGVEEETPGVLAEVVNVFGGNRALSVVDTATVIGGRLRTLSPPCPGLVNKFGRYAMFLDTRGKQAKFATALLGMAAPRYQSVTLQAYAVQDPFLPVPTVVHESLQFDEIQNPATPFIAAINQGRSIPNVLAVAETPFYQIASATCAPVVGTCVPVDAGLACLPIPADQPITVVVRNSATGAVISSTPVAPARGGSVAQVNLAFHTGDDTTPPTLTSTPWTPMPPHVVDTTDPLVLGFSEPVRFTAIPPSGQLVTLIDETTGIKLQAIPKLSNGNRQLTLTPVPPMAMGHSFLLELPTLADLAGNPFGQQLAFRTYQPEVSATAAARLTREKIQTAVTARGGAQLPESLGLKDIDFITVSPDQSRDKKWHTWLTGVGNARDRGVQFLNVHVPSLATAEPLTVIPGGVRYYSNVRLFRDFAMTPRNVSPLSASLTAWKARQLAYDQGDPGNRLCSSDTSAITSWLGQQIAAGRTVGTKIGCGNLALFTSFNDYYSILHAWDVTDPAQPVFLSQRLLSDNGAQYQFARQSHAPEGLGLAKSFDLLRGVDITHTWHQSSDVHQDTTAAYVAMNNLGLGMIDLDRNMPEVTRAEREGTPPPAVIDSEAVYSGPYYQDVRVVGGQVVAITDGVLSLLEIFPPSLAMPSTAPVQLPFTPYALAVAEGLMYPSTTPGAAPVSKNMAFVTGAQGGFAGIEILATGDGQMVSHVPTPASPPARSGALTVGSLIGGSCPELMFRTSASPVLTVKTTTNTRYYLGLCRDLSPGSLIAVSGVTEAMKKPTLYVLQAPGPIPAGVHGYIVVFVTNSGKFIGSLPAQVTIVDQANAQVEITDIPTGPAMVTTAREIYRTMADASEYKLVGVISNNSPGVNYVDSTPDDMLGELAPTAEINPLIASDIVILDHEDKVNVTALRHVEIDRDSMVAYVAANWKKNTEEFQGILVFDISRLHGGLLDADQDGWDDRIIGRIPIIGPGQTITGGFLNKFRYDSKRRLIYAAIDAYPKDRTELSVAIVKVNSRGEAGLKLVAGVAGTGSSVHEYPSPDGTTDLMYITPFDVSVGGIYAKFSLDADPGGPITYHVTELPYSGNPNDVILDLNNHRDTGTFDPSTGRVHFFLTTTDFQSIGLGSVVAVDFTDQNGAFLKRAILDLVPTRVRTFDTRVKTVIDKTNRQYTEYTGELHFFLPYEAKVTIDVDGTVVPQDFGGTVGIAPFRDVTLPAGFSKVVLTPAMAPFPGEHTFTVKAVFRDPDIFTIQTGKVVHDVNITDSLPVGHGVSADGVDLSDGHLSIARVDLAIPGVGPTLQFSRTYSSGGTRGSGPMGAGWSHNYQTSLSMDGVGVVSVSAGDGGGGRFTPAGAAPGGGTLFKAQAGFHGRLISLNGEYDYYTKGRYRYHFAPAGAGGTASSYHLTFIEDTHGNRLTFTYEGENLKKATDAVGRELTFTYEKKGHIPEDRITKVEGPLGLEVTFDYDDYANLIKATRSVRVEEYHYSIDKPLDRHNLREVVDPNGNSTVYEYYTDADNIPGVTGGAQPAAAGVSVPPRTEMLKSITEGRGADRAVTTYAYDYSNSPSRLVTTIDDGRTPSVRTTNVLNARGNITETRVATASGDQVTRFRWAYEDNIDDVYMTQKTDPLGRVTKYFYDANGNVTDEKVDLSAPSAYAAVKDAAGTPVSEIVTHYEYDLTFNKATRKVDADGNETTWQLDPATGAVLSMTLDPRDGTGDIVTSYSYGSITTPAGELHSVLKSVTDPMGHAFTYTTFDAYGNATRAVDAAGKTSTYTYDARGRLLESTDGIGHHTSTAYNDLDQPLTVRKFAGVQPGDPAMASPDQIVTTTYYSGGQEKTITDRSDHTVTLTYDSRNRLIKQVDETIDAGGSSIELTLQYGYDAANNRVTETDRRGITRTLRYDELNRNTRVELGAKTLTANTYDLAGNRLTSTDIHNHLTRYEYDRLYRPVRTVLPQSPYFTLAEYDLGGHVTRTVDANGHDSRTAYDGVYRVKSRTDALGITITYAYNHAGSLVREENATRGIVVTHGPFDALNRSRGMTRTFTDPVTGAVVTYVSTTTFDDAAHAVETVTAGGVRARAVHNGLDQMISTTADPGGLDLTTTIQYDQTGNVAAIKEPGSAAPDQQTVYDGLGRVVVRQVPLGGSEQFYYDGNGNLVQHVSRRGIVTESTYDDLNRLLTTTVTESISGGGAPRRTVSVTYDDAANTMVKTDWRGGQTRSESDAMDREILAIDARGGTIASTWDGVNRIGETTRRNYHKTFAYDALGRPIRATDEDGPDGPVTVTTQYLDNRNRRLDTDRRGITTITEMDALGRERRTLRSAPELAAEYGAAEVAVSETRYDGDDRVVDEVDALGHVRHFVFDAAGRLERSIEGFGTPLAATTAYTYDPSGRVLTTTDPMNHVTSYAYDARHRKTGETNAVGTTTFTYNHDDLIESTTEPNGEDYTTRFTYDEYNRVLTVDERRAGAGGIAAYVYDGNGNLTSETDPSGITRTTTYDALNRPTDSYVGGGQHWHYEYDPDGNRTLTVDPNGQRVTKVYDYLGRLASRTYANHTVDPDGNPVYPKLLSVSYGYDANGNETSITARKQFDTGQTVDEVTVKTYDHLDRLATETNPDGKTLTYTYNRNGDRTTLRDSDGVLTTWSYDDRNRLRTVTAEAGAAAPATSYEYWPNGLEKRVTYANGTTTDTTYDAANRVQDIVNRAGETVVSRYGYTYDSNGNRLTQSETHARVAAPETASYEYDSLNRLSTVTYGSGAVTYTYAANGNRLTEIGTDPISGQAVNRQFVYDGQNRLTGIVNHIDPGASIALSYDSNGNTTQKKVGQLDAEGGVSGPSVVTNYAYDIRDRLARVDVAGGVAWFDYDDLNRRTKNVSPFSNIRYLPDAAGVVQEYDGGSLVTTVKYTYARGLLSMTLAGTGTRRSFFYLPDALRSTSELTDDAGAITATYRYDAWGRVRESATTTPNVRLFTGHYLDPQTGLYYFGGRYYDASTGRFLSVDPASGDVRTPISRHPYLYAQSNPLAYVDPTGREAEPAQPQQAPEGTFSEWAKLVGTAGLKNIAAPVGGLIRSGVLGLADIAMAGIGYLAMEATQGKYTDEIGGLLTPESDIGKLAAEKGFVGAIKESGTGFVKDQVMGIVTFPQRLKAAAESGDPEQLGGILVEGVQLGQSIKGPGMTIAKTLEKSAVRLTERVKLTYDLLQRPREGPKIPGTNVKSEGAFAARDAWVIAGVCTASGVKGCGIGGGLKEKRGWSQIWKNLKAEESLARGRFDPKEMKHPGDLDLMKYLDSEPWMMDTAEAWKLNRKLTAPLLDTHEGHGVLGEYMPPGVVPPEAVQAYKSINPAAVHDVKGVRAIPYQAEGIPRVKPDGTVDRVTPIIKPSSGKPVQRAVAQNTIDYLNPANRIVIPPATFGWSSYASWYLNYHFSQAVKEEEKK